MKTQVISIANQKGGVSKTTTAQAAATVLNQQGKKTLCVDLDPQANLSFAMGADLDDTPTVYNVLKGELSAAEIRQQTESGDILPANILLSGADTEFTATGREYLLKEAIQDIAGEYAYVLIDCPPALSVLTINAFAASGWIVVPSIADVFSLQGMAQLSNTIQSVRKYCNQGLKVAGILLTRFNPRINLSGHIQTLLDGATQRMGTHLFDTFIRNSVSVQESQYQRQNVIEYDRKSNAMQDYANFIRELEVIIHG
jgi:chromosome partitioning protein